MQLVSSRIWTCVAVSISYNDNHYTTGTSIQIQWNSKNLTPFGSVELILKNKEFILMMLFLKKNKSIWFSFFSHIHMSGCVCARKKSD